MSYLPLLRLAPSFSNFTTPTPKAEGLYTYLGNVLPPFDNKDTSYWAVQLNDVPFLFLGASRAHEEARRDGQWDTGLTRAQAGSKFTVTLLDPLFIIELQICLKRDCDIQCQNILLYW